MGDDERGEFMYKYVSNGIYVPGGDTSTLLDDGALFVARFEDDGTGDWVALTPEATGMDAAKSLIFTAHGCLQGRCHDDGPPGMDRGQPGGGRGLLLPDQQLPTRRSRPMTGRSAPMPAATR